MKTLCRFDQCLLFLDSLIKKIKRQGEGEDIHKHEEMKMEFTREFDPIKKNQRHKLVTKLSMKGKLLKSHLDFILQRNIDNNIPVFKDFHLLNVSEFMILGFCLFPVIAGC